MDSSQRVSISAANIADFFNTVGRRAADRVQGQDTFPMGGYFNEFRRSAVTVTLVEQLRAAVEQCMTTAGLDVAAITKNANTFLLWYSDKQNSIAAGLLGRGGQVNVLLMVAAKSFFASMHQSGGRLWCETASSDFADPQRFHDFEVPGGVVRDVLRILYSSDTGKWLRQVQKEPETTSYSRDISRGWRSQVSADGSGRVNLYSGTTVVQFHKTLHFMLNMCGNMAMETQLARRSFFIAMVNVTRHKKYSADALVDAKAVKLFGVLDLRYSWDATFAAAAAQCEELAYRVNEIYNEQSEDCTMTEAGMTCELPRSKADQLRTGIIRDVKHRRGCPCEGTLDCSLQSAMPCAEGSRARAELRCQVCMKRWLWRLQGQRSARTPSFLRLKPHVKPSWEFTEGNGLSTVDDFVQPSSPTSEDCPALQYIAYNDMLRRVAVRSNHVFSTNFEEHKTHWHGWRHATPCNWMELQPKPTLAEVILWCRMTEKTLMIYLKHNGVGGTTSNRTDQISGCQTLSIGAVAAWCTTRNHMVGAERIRMLIGSLGFADVENFVSCNGDALRRHLGRNPTITLAEEEVLVSAHRNFQQVVGAVGERQERAADGPDVAADMLGALEASGLAMESFRDVAHGHEELFV